jgi:methylenetetrahydrofolate--tRNA-(uracil-5-)-methyltransferase
MSKAPPSGLLAGASPPPSDLGPREPAPPPPPRWARCSAHITGGADAEAFQPMNVNFGLFPTSTPTSLPCRR